MFSHSNNSRHQYLYFIAGSKHTADEAYRVLRDQREDRDTAIKSADAGKLRERAKAMRAEAIVIDMSKSEPERLEAQADLAEMDAHVAVGKACYEEAVRERDFLAAILAAIEPLRKYRHLPDHEAMQACQREEWAAELRARATDFICCNGFIPPDHWAAMRQHPDFEEVILPHVLAIQDSRRQGRIPSVPRPAFLEVLEKALPGLEAPDSSAALSSAPPVARLAR